MSRDVAQARLYLIGGATLVFLGGLLVAIGHWNRAEIDRAFVEAAAQAARSPARQGGVRFWTPGIGGLPDGAARVRLEAEERLRQVRASVPALPPSLPSAPATPVPPPGPGIKTPAAPR